MPTYDYVCDACEHEFEHFQGINDPHLKKCPKCKKAKLRRLFGTGGAIMFKGSGFYITDYRSEGYKQSAAADKSSNESKSETKSDSKSDSSAKSESTPKSESKPTSKPTSDKPNSSKPSGGKSGGKK